MEECWDDIVRVSDTSVLADFKCGVKSMDDFIHDKQKGLAKFIELRLSCLWVVFKGKRAVAFFALSKDALTINNDDMRTMGGGMASKAVEYGDEFWNRDKFPAVEIDYLAVCEDYRNDPDIHLGRAVLDAIEQMVARDSLSATMFLTVEALDTKEYSAVGFYKNCDFKLSEVAQNKYNYEMTFGNRPTTRRMYRIIIPYQA